MKVSSFGEAAGRNVNGRVQDRNYCAFSLLFVLKVETV
jgi:hypothetical protein